MVLGPEQVRLGQGPAWRGSRSTRPKGQVHRRRRARGVRRPRALRGAGCPQPGGSWPGRGTTARGRASGTQAGRESGSATRPASPHGDPGSVGRADPVIRPPGLRASRPPRLPASRSAPTSGARPAAPAPAPARLASPYPGGYGRAGEGRAERTEGLRGWRARAQQGPERAARAGPSPDREDRGPQFSSHRLSPAPAQLDWPSVASIPPLAKSHWASRKWRVAGSPGGRSFQC